MDRKQAQNLIKETFENPFEKDKFIRFVKNFLNKIEDSSFVYRGNYIPEAYRQYINTVERIGKYTDGEHTVDLLVITLKKETSLERARTMQRNFVAWYLNGSRGGEMKDAALVAYVSPSEDDWRFSLVKMDYRFEKTKTGKMKVKEEFTPARRWSFLVGSNEKSHTAQTRLVKLLADDTNSPTLQELENAFDIETVTNEFFLKYRELFLRTKDELDKVLKKNPQVKADFDAKGVDTVNFAKKLLGQIVFLYFLQKKGWFGVERDSDWGTGTKHFLRELFEKKHSDYNNFYNDILEPLFYESLRIDRSHDDDYYSRFNCKIPFLNGGLFDPIGNYDWVHTDINLPNDLFSNRRKTREGDIGDGILDVFDRYNFTVREDEPLEREVAIDPELLGKAYEKFNAIRYDNFDEFKKVLKSGKKGEETKFNKKFGVYYTPREIVHYMCKQSLIYYLATELEGKVTKEDIEKLVYTGDQISQNEEAAFIKEHDIRNGKQKSTRIVSKLPESIRHNAHLIDKALANIRVCDPAVGSGAFPVGMMHEIVNIRNVLSAFINDGNRNVYEFKRRCIEHSIYGVDIDPGAVEIAKLRLWLSLIVDEDDYKNIKPLPNLDYKIVCGNSLIGVEKDLLNEPLFSDLEKLKPLYFNETNPSKKQEYKEKIDNLISKITNGKKEFDFEIYFSEVYHDRGGFDVFIGNPPYGAKFSREEINSFLKMYKYQDYQLDSYLLFIEKSLYTLRDDGILSFIIPNTWLQNLLTRKIRKWLFNSKVLLSVSHFNEKVFDAVVDNEVIFIQNKNPQQDSNIRINIHDSFNIIDNYKIKQSQWNELDGNPVNIFDTPALSSIKLKIQRHKKLSEICKITQGAKPFQVNKGKPPQTREIVDKKPFVSETKCDSTFRPLLRGSLIQRYTILWKNNYWISFGEWLAEPRYSANYDAKEKILIRQTGDRIVAALDAKQFIVRDNLYTVVLKNKSFRLRYILGLLNSKLINWFYQKIINPEVGEALSQIKRGHLVIIPIAECSSDIQITIEKIVNKIMTIKQTNPHADTFKLERDIDNIIYELYSLTDKEIELIET